jgi:aspartyl-tRNA(Asn)/glutamyl-tRNA(Gln) amidotransferase subunit C
MPVTLEDVDHIALLARLGLADEERHALRQELESILGYVDQLRGLDTENVEPTTSVVDVAAPFREDRVTSPERPDEITAGAPEREGTHLRVPKILLGNE